jgi:broad specificity phosphatase PhoE
MSLHQRKIWLARHGETEWSRQLRHTSRTDLPLDDLGQAEGEALGRRLAGKGFAVVLTSPLARAVDTARLAGFGEVAIEDPDLSEWDYGALEGRTTVDIVREYPGWTIWHGPWPDGETVDQVVARADRVLARCTAAAVDGDALLFGHGHMLRVLAARWLRLPGASGGLFDLSTGTVSVLGSDRELPVIETWNEACHLAAPG